MTGKEKCKLLRQIRQEIAETNGIVYKAADCTYEGEDCLGTCPKCDKEIAYLETELNKKAANGEAITLSGLSVGTFRAEVADTSKSNISPKKSVIDSIRMQVRKLLESIAPKHSDEEVWGDFEVAECECPAEPETMEHGDIMYTGDIEEFPYHDISKITIEELDLSTHSYSCLKNAGILTVGDITQRTEESLAETFSTASIIEIKNKLDFLGLSFATSERFVMGDIDIG